MTEPGMQRQSSPSLLSAGLQASSERNEIEREMNKLLFERTVASQEAVLHTLTDEMCRQAGQATLAAVGGRAA